MAREPEPGRLFLAADGRVAHAAGRAAGPELQRAIIERFAGISREQVGVFAIESPEPILVAYRAVDDGTFMFLWPDPAYVPMADSTGPHPAPSGRPPWGATGQVHDAGALDQIVGSSEAIQQLKLDIAKIAPLHVPVLIVGESGTGKELAALAIHALSSRRDHQMVFVNAAALPGGLVESELFGYEAGAFTGAERAGRKGKFELANRSSLFFDEVGDMPAAIQVKLLRVIQDGVFERVGGGKLQHSDFRLICASNRNFQRMIDDGEFRLDLFYRISGITIRMPSLRERLEDIPQLVRAFLAAFAARHRTPLKAVDDRVFGFLREQSWPGNVRQLLHEVERAAIFCDAERLTVDDFRPRGGMVHVAAAEPAVEVEAQAGIEGVPSQGTVREAVEALERSMIREAMARWGGNKKKVAEELGISRAYLYKKLMS